MNTFTKNILWAIGGGIVVFFLIRSCDGSEPQKTVTTKTIVKQYDTIYFPEPIKTIEKKYVYVTKTDTIERENPLNLYYFRKWKERVESRKVDDSLFFDAITEREYNQVFEDSASKIEIYSKVQGTLLSQSPKLTIKPQTVKVPYRRFTVLSGFELSNTSKLDEFAAKATIGVQNKSGMIYRAGYDTNKNISVGLDFNIWTHTR